MALPDPLRPAPRRRLRVRGRVAALLAPLAAAALLIAAGCGGGSSSPSSTGATTTAPPPASTGITPTPTIKKTGIKAIDRYLTDVAVAAAALGDFGKVLAEAGIGSGLRARQADLRAALARFDGAMTRIGQRKLPDVPSITRQRNRVQKAGRRLTSSLLRFVEAAARGDVATVQSLLPDVNGRVDDFVAASRS
jgi:hypothetical protein